MTIGDRKFHVCNILHHKLRITTRDQIRTDACSRVRVIGGLGKRYLAKRLEEEEEETLMEQRRSTQSIQGSAW